MAVMNSYKKELKKGTKIEAEEHKDVTKGKKSVARKIARAHIKGENIPDYYERLAKLEKTAKKAMKLKKKTKKS